MRQLHASDAEFLEAFRDQGVARAASVNTIGVISRADEIGGGRLDAMSSARAVARRYRGEPALRGLCQNFVAVAGLLAQTARTLRQAEFAALPRAGPHARRDDLDARAVHRRPVRRRRRAGRAAQHAAARRRAAALLQRFGMFGVRLCIALLHQGTDSPAALAVELVRQLRADRAAARAAQPVRRAPRPAQGPVGAARAGRRAARRPAAGAARSWPGRSSGSSPAPTSSPSCGCSAALRSRGGAAAGRGAGRGRTAARRGRRRRAHPARPCRPTPARSTCGAAALAALSRWQDLAENPMTARAAADACRVVVRTCEGMLVGAAR